MTAAIMEIPSNKWECQRKLDLDKGFKDALRDYCKRRWPHHTAKYAAREFDLTVDEGRGLANGTASMTTVEKTFKGRPEVAVPVVEEVCGVQLAGYFRHLFLTDPAAEAIKAHEHEQLASAAYRALETAPAPAGEGRRSWKGAREVGADTAGRLAGGDQ